MERHGVPPTGAEPTRAQRALREAASRLKEGPVPGPDQSPAVQDEVVVEESPAEAEDAPEVDRADRACRLLELDEVFVGRPALGAEFAYRDASDDVLARVEVLHTPENSKLGALMAGESTRHVDERWVVVDEGGVLFFVEQYRATGRSSYAVFDPDGAALGTYVTDGGVLHRDVVVRESSSAPVARMRVGHHRHVITSASGAEIGYCWRTFSAIGNDDDDEEWGLRIEEEAELLDRRALVAAPLVCHLMAYPKRHFDSGGEIGIILVETVPPVGLVVVGIERTLDGLYWLRRRLD
jgi:hypothetical protein